MRCQTAEERILEDEEQIEYLTAWIKNDIEKKKRISAIKQAMKGKSLLKKIPYYMEIWRIKRSYRRINNEI